MTKTIWLVQLQRHGNSWNPIPSKSCVVCGCDTEENAHKAGQQLVWMYNNPRSGFQEHLCGTVTHDILIFDPEYTYAVKKHEGEWI